MIRMTREGNVKMTVDELEFSDCKKAVDFTFENPWERKGYGDGVCSA